MKDYLLFIDTEASGLPKNWNLPYDSVGNWPYCVQISWIIYTKDGREIKEENHYIKNNDFDIADSATKIHGITREFLNANGKCRKDILKLLTEDLLKYDSLIVGHFMQFDIHMLGADFFRAGMENPVKKECTFCTMLATTHLVKNPSVKFLRLEQLYKTLFNKTLENHHNAIVDAKATASCFFEMMKRREINEEIIEQQQKEVLKKDTLPDKYGCLPILVFIFLTVLIAYCL
ncbi:MAG: 3-5 exonuclease [Segetibacter sp.]|nr:3-5 exonuclease [Segetibacter sp.]